MKVTLIQFLSLLILLNCTPKEDDVLSTGNKRLPFDYFYLTTHLKGNRQDYFYTKAVLSENDPNTSSLKYWQYSSQETTGAVAPECKQEHSRDNNVITFKVSCALNRQGDVKPNELEWKEKINYEVKVNADISNMKVTSAIISFPEYDQIIDFTHIAIITHSGGDVNQNGEASYDQIKISVSEKVFTKENEPLTIFFRSIEILPLFFNPSLSYGSVIDVESNEYKTVKIGNQTWMAENLRVKKYKNGDLIGTTTPVTLNIRDEPQPKYEWVYEGKNDNLPALGRLYTWYAISDPRGVCPSGWHIPSDSEWTILSDYLGGQTIAGGKLKEVGVENWTTPNIGGINSTGFTGVSGGWRGGSGAFGGKGFDGDWWSSTENATTSIYTRNLNYKTKEFLKSSITLTGAISVRCLKD